jgi:hypothetical protein
MKHIALALGAFLLVAGSAAAPPPPELKGFVVETKADMFGYYMPAKEIRAGKFKLILIGIGAREDFQSFARGERWNGNWAPMLLQFAPAGSVQKYGEGGPYWEGAFRVLPTAYAVTNKQIAFAGTHPSLGRVSFRGTFDLAALKAEQKIGNGGSGKIVLRGDLTVGGKTYPGLTFTWFGGD